jgi:putative endonuclease
VRQRSAGRGGELAALILLTLKGYRLRHRNWQGPSGELDLVVERRGDLVFVEVKTRRGRLFGGAAAAVDRSKQRALVRTAAAYLSRYGLWDRPSSFDVVTIERSTRPPFWRIRHLRNAFSAELDRSV